MTNTGNVGVSMALYRTPIWEVAHLIEQLTALGSTKIYLVDNTESRGNTYCDDCDDISILRADRVVLIQTGTNLGYGRAHNIAIRDSVLRNEFHLVCNPDIEITTDAFRELVDVMRKRPDVGLCMPRILAPDGSQQYLCKRAPTPMDLLIRRFLPSWAFIGRRNIYEMRDHSYDEEMNPETLSGCFMLFRSSVLKQLCGFDERFFLYMEDVDLSRRAGKIAKNLYFPKISAVHTHKKGSYRNYRLLVRHIVSAIKYFNKWGWTG